MAPNVAVQWSVLLQEIPGSFLSIKIIYPEVSMVFLSKSHEHLL
jgi:hypothetical protein